MSLLKRFGFYLIGFSIGLIFLAFFFKEKNTSFCYSPTCRVLKNIRTKTLELSPETHQFLKNNKIDSVSIDSILVDGDVNFSKSNTKLDSCKMYIIEGVMAKKYVALTITNCDSIATIQKIYY